MSEVNVSRTVVSPDAPEQYVRGVRVDIEFSGGALRLVGRAREVVNLLDIVASGLEAVQLGIAKDREQDVVRADLKVVASPMRVRSIPTASDTGDVVSAGFVRGLRTEVYEYDGAVYAVVSVSDVSGRETRASGELAEVIRLLERACIEIILVSDRLR